MSYFQSTDVYFSTHQRWKGTFSISSVHSGRFPVFKRVGWTRAGRLLSFGLLEIQVMFLVWLLGPTSCTAKTCFNPGDGEVLVNCVALLLVVAVMVAMMKL